MTALDHAFLDRFQLLDAGPKNPKGSPPAKKLSLLLRSSFIADPGKVFTWGDWSAIEARKLPWLAGSDGGDAQLDIFRESDNDPTKPDIYVQTAVKLVKDGPLFGATGEEVWAILKDRSHKLQKDADELRQSRGKVPVLSLGFGGSIGALIAMAANYRVYLDETTAQEVVDSWRATNQWAPEFWGKYDDDNCYGLWGAAMSALGNPDTIYEAGRVAYVYDPGYMGGTLVCALPCGRWLMYPAIRWERREVKVVDKVTGKTSLEKRTQLTFLKAYGRPSLWYGKLCIDGSALVATDRGWVPLVDVEVSDRLWDGEEWVLHGGLRYQGEKLTVPVDGVRMTPDHRVLTNGGWREAQACEGLERYGVRLPDGLASGASYAAWRTFAVGLPLHLRANVNSEVGWVAEEKPEAVASVLRMRDGSVDWSGEPDARNDGASSVCGVALDASPLPTAVASVMGRLRRSRHFCVRAVDALRELLGRHGSGLQAGAAAGTGGQRRPVQAGKLHLGDAPRAGFEHPAVTAYEHEGAVAQNGGQPLDDPLSLAPRAVYDLLNAGPRSRFVVLGESGPMIVHNCENVTQASAASILRRTLKRLEYGRLVTSEPLRDWMPVVMHTHDEIVTEVAEADQPAASRMLLRLMETNDAWDEGLPLKAEITTGWYYSKSGVFK